MTKYFIYTSRITFLVRALVQALILFFFPWEPVNVVTRCSISITCVICYLTQYALLKVALKGFMAVPGSCFNTLILFFISNVMPH